MKRRQFFGIAAAGAAGLVVTGAAPWTGASAERLALAQPGLLNVLRNHGLIREIGLLYRDAYPHEADPQILESLLRAGHRSGSGPAHAARLDRQSRRDFAEKRTVTLKGWILSVTEARQCALYSFVA